MEMTKDILEHSEQETEPIFLKDVTENEAALAYLILLKVTIKKIMVEHYMSEELN